MNEPGSPGILEPWREVSRRNPESVAITDGGTTWSHRELSARVSAWASRIESLPASSRNIAILLPHCADAIAAMLGILEAGRCFVALDPSRPAARHKEILAYTDADALLAMPGDDEALRAEGWEGRAIFPPDDCPQERAAGDGAGPAAPACIYFTSGSTGEPKGVLWSVRTLRRAAENIGAMFAFHDADRHALLTPLAVASAPAQILATIWAGGALCLFEARRHGISALARWLGESKITTIQTTPALFRAVAREAAGQKRWPALRSVKLGGEASSAADARLFETFAAPGAVLVNGLGITEAGFNVCWFEWKPGGPLDGGLLPIGRPSAGIEITVESAPGIPAAVGEAGEIVVRSAALAEGYWKDEEQTARIYRDLPDRPGWRELRTGDAGAFRGDGQLLHRGRLDHRVKIRGHGVDPAYVESVIAGISAVAGAAVIPVETLGETRLYAFVQFQPGANSDTTPLRRTILDLLPAHMAPARIHPLAMLPRLEGGKIDRRALASLARLPDAARAATKTRPGAKDRPATEMEELVATAWMEALHLDAIGGSEDFFDIGGDSLSAAIISAKLNALLGVELQLDAFAENPTVTLMAGLMERICATRGGRTLPPLVKVPRDKPLPISLSQQHVWESYHAPGGSTGYVMTTMHRITGRLDVTAFKKSLEELVTRHEMLRSTFAEENGRPVLIIHAPGTVDLPLADLSASPDPQKEAALLLENERPVSFDLSRGPLVRFSLARLGETEHWFQIVNHHLISDGWSWKIFFNELGPLYETHCRGEAPPPRETAMDYADYAAWQRSALQPDGQRYKDLLAWWKQALRDAPPEITFPFRRDKPRPDAAPSEGCIVWQQEPALAAELDKLAAKEGVTFYMLRLAGFAAQAALETHQHDLLLGGYADNRALLEFQKMFGFFANQTVVRLKLAEGFTFRRWLAHVRATVMEAVARAEIPYNVVRDELTREGITPPAINAVLIASELMPSVRAGGTDFTYLERKTKIMPWGFSMIFYRDCPRCEARFDATIYDPAGVRSMVERYNQFMAAACAQPDRPLEELLPRADRPAPAPAARIRSTGGNPEDHPLALLTPAPLSNAVKLFVWPGEGSDAMALAALARHLGPGVALHAIQHRGLGGGRLYDTGIEAMASHGLGAIRHAQPAGPYFLCGISLGGLVALEAARRLRAEGQAVDFLALVDPPGAPSPDLDAGSGGGQLRGLWEKIQRGRARRSLRKSGRSPRLLPARDRFLYLGEAFSLARGGYQPGPYDGAAHLLFGEGIVNPHLFIQNETSVLRGVFTGPLAVKTLPGEPGQRLLEPGVAALASHLAGVVAGWDAAALWDGLAPWWDARIANEGSDLFRSVALETMDRLADIRPGFRVLDVACGNGWFSRKMARAGARVTAIDISPGMLERARARGDVPGIDYLPLDASRSGGLAVLGRDCYDMAVCNMALQDIANLEPMFNGVFATVKPGARFIVSFAHPAGAARAGVPRNRPLPQVALPNQPRPHIEVVRPIADILRTVREAGWRVDQVVELPSPSAPVIAILALTRA